jgi:hypothetical protein
MKEKKTISAKQVSNVSAGKKRNGKDSEGTSVKNNDYWDRITDDPASGYLNEESGEADDLLNIDQEPGDNERGDETA